MKSKKIEKLLYKAYLYFVMSFLLVPTNNNKNEVYDIVNGKEIYIIDETNDDDPNIKIVNSYKINDLKSMNEILEQLLKYNNEKENSSWNRNKISLLLEWIAHNICYDCGIKREMTADVDFRQSEENFYTLRLKKN